MKYTFQLIVAITLLSCSPRILVDPANEKSSPPTNRSAKQDPNTPFVFIFDTETKLDTSHYLGLVEILDTGFTMNCNLTTVKSLAKEKAIALGGNCLVVYEHKTPDKKSTCHRIRAKVYRVKNPRDYELKIIWSKDRKLEIRDYKGSTQKRPSLAATYTGFEYDFFPNHSRINIL